ncbi:MAG TPA: protease pro-enzyme activation domain-containing protein [Verrucomicrobiae bacterium]|nr:protease pro-enzyme activation domain-containing protein [Verrucomicrobiae bacterium]
MSRRFVSPSSRIEWLFRGFAMAMVFLFVSAAIASATDLKIIPGHVPKGMNGVAAVSHLPSTNRLRLVVGLPLRNQASLDNLLVEQQDPTSTNFHRWLKPEEFAQQFGPTTEDYEKVVHFAESNGLVVESLTSNRMLVDVHGEVTNIEKAFHLGLHVYPHPTENRNFYAPDTEPTVDASVPILHISGLDNFILPHRFGGGIKPLDTNPIVAYATGSSPGGFFMGKDFRTAYVPGVTNTGAGQYIAVVDVGGPYYSKDVYLYETNAGLSTNTVVTNILLSGSTGIPVGNTANEGEQVLDIDMAMSMAPDATILNYEGEAHDVFNRIASDNLAKQITLSYGFGIDATIIQYFQQFVAQGQAFSQASGDGGADLDGGTGLTGVPYATIVGGVSLTTSGAGGPWQSDITWGGSGGGVSGYGIPTWQQGVSMVSNLGSTNFRNYPDVAMPAINIFTVYENGTLIGGTGGTSAASPLWAGFMALVNQQAASLGQTSVGSPNPAIYAIGRGPLATYTKAFHDITSGNTFNSQNPTKYPAVSGYDLATGWGSPTGSNTINALVGTGTNDFTFYILPGVLNIVPGGTLAATIPVTRPNGYNGTISFAISGLPTGVTAVFNPVATTSSSLLTFSVAQTALPGTNSITITGTSGVLSHTVKLNLAIVSPIPGSTPVNLSSLYNRVGIWSDGRTFSGGVDNVGYAFSANLVSASPSWNGLVFNLGPANALDVVSCSSQVVTLPAGNFTSLNILGTGVEGTQTAQTLTVTYTDNSTTKFTNSWSDWANPQHFASETQVINMAYRNNGSGSKDLFTSVNLYGHSFALDETKIVKTVTLPTNANVIVAGIVLANEPAAVSLGLYYNRPGMYSDGVTFTNPATGGADGGGAAYSATLLTGSQIWTNTPFNFGPANTNNIISTAGQTILLPKGNYSILRMIASGVQGSQASQTFTVTYADGTTNSFLQSLSDWFSPQNFSGESKAITMGHRNSSNGTADNRTFYFYGYSFKLNNAKVVQSLTLPSDANVLVAAVSLVPNWAPAFKVNPFIESAITAGQSYSATMVTNASDLNGDALTYAKVNGPSWLNVATSGFLSGTPLSSQTGNNTFLVSVIDSGGMSNTATMTINVLPAPAIVSGFTSNTNGISMNWTGGIGPFQLQMSTNLAPGSWINVGSPISSNTFIIQPNGPAAFYRIMGN